MPDQLSNLIYAVDPRLLMAIGPPLVAILLAVPIARWVVPWIRRLRSGKHWIVLVRIGASAAAVLAAWAAFVSLVDERPDPGLEEFLRAARRVIPDHENGAIAVAGLTAPKGVDIVVHGRLIKDVGEAAYVGRIPWTELQKITEMPGSLHLTASSEELVCWVYPDAVRNGEKCATEQRLRELLVENAELISRYRRVLEMPEFGPTTRNGQLLITLNRLLYAETQLLLRERRAGEAFAKWRPNQVFLSRALLGTNTWVDKAILLVCQGLSLAALEEILHHDPAIARRHREEINALLRPRGLAAYNLRGIMLGEYGLWDPMPTSGSGLKFWVHPTFWGNRFYRYAKDFEEVERTPYADLSAFGQRLARDHVEGWSSDYLTDPVNAVFVRGPLSGQPKALEMVKQMHLAEVQKALLLVRTEIAMRGTPDSEVPVFLESAPLQLHDPISGSAIRWDAKERRIYFDIPGTEGARSVRL